MTAEEFKSLTGSSGGWGQGPEEGDGGSGPIRASKPSKNKKTRPSLPSQENIGGFEGDISTDELSDSPFPTSTRNNPPGQQRRPGSRGRGRSRPDVPREQEPSQQGQLAAITHANGTVQLFMISPFASDSALQDFGNGSNPIVGLTPADGPVQLFRISPQSLSNPGMGDLVGVAQPNGPLELFRRNPLPSNSPFRNLGNGTAQLAGITHPNGSVELFRINPSTSDNTLSGGYSSGGYSSSPSSSNNGNMNSFSLGQPLGVDQLNGVGSSGVSADLVERLAQELAQRFNLGQLTGQNTPSQTFNNGPSFGNGFGASGPVLGPRQLSQSISGDQINSNGNLSPDLAQAVQMILARHPN